MRPLAELAAMIGAVLLLIGLPLLLLVEAVRWVGSVVGVW